MKTTRILIFAKAPLPGFAKTRLVPALGAAGAAALARRMLEHAAHAALAAATGPVELCATPAPADRAWEAVALPPALLRSDQGEGDLGARMARAAARTLATGERVLLIGADCPALDAARLRAAARALDAHDASLVPSADGGYALLGLKAFRPELFDGLRWSTSTVAAATLARIARLGWRVQRLPTVHDIDTPADLRWLPAAWRVEAGVAAPARWLSAAKLL